MVSKMYNFNSFSISNLSRIEVYVLKGLLAQNREGFLESVDDELYFEDIDKDFASKLDDITLIKKAYDIFNLDEELILDIYDSIVDEKCLDIRKINGNIERGVSPLAMFYKEDTSTWYLEYFKKRGSHTIRLDSIESIVESQEKYAGTRGSSSGWKLNSKPERVRLRIYEERGIVESFTREMIGRKVHRLDYKEGYAELEATVEDINILKVWLRKNTPMAIVLEPEQLRLDMAEEARQVRDMYL